ncbi:HAMP domain-containing histidine kinase [Patescibacteria group bacterium]|nr:HAMP domain-containing histidine kinase [Patescibacteria group bacterium]
MATTTLSLCGAFFLSYYLNSYNKKNTYAARLIVLLTGITTIIDMTPWVFKGLKYNTQHLLPVASYGIILYLLQFFGVLFLTILVLWKGAHSTSKLRSEQNKYILIGLVPTLILAPITGFILPIAFNNSNFIVVSPIYATFTICMIGYTIIKHKLFDIRLVVARILAYFLSLSVVSALYGFILLGIINLVFRPHISISVEVVMAVATGLASVSFARIRKLFDKVTNRFFYQDAYDVQIFLDSFNKILVTNFEFQKLLEKVLKIILQNLKSEFIYFHIIHNNRITELGSPGYIPLKDNDWLQIDNNMMKSKVIVLDSIEGDHNHIKEILKQNNISVLARLTTNKNDYGIGYLLLGPKKSGNIYSLQDINVIEIITNELVVAVQNVLHTEEIENFNLTLQQKVIDATRKLRKTNDKLRALDEAKDDFVSMASHQLRTPLTSVKGNISLVLDGDAGQITKLQRQLLDQAFASSQRMVYLIADLLNVSRLKTGKFVIERAPVNLADVIEEEVNQLIDTALSRQLTLTYKKPENITELMLDDTKTRQVIMNFIDNAIYYTPAGGRIDVLLSETTSVVECRVIDNGIGVSKSEQHHLFTKFFRAANARKARPDGTGLGLFMAKKVIASEGGAIIFESVEGKGSTFGFSFPKAALAVNKVPNDGVSSSTAQLAAVK